MAVLLRSGVICGGLRKQLAQRGWIVSQILHSEDRLDCRVKVELKVLYIQELEGGGYLPPTSTD